MSIHEILTSGQVKVRSRPKQVNMHIFRSGLTNQVVWHHLCVCISILSRVIGEKREHIDQRESTLPRSCPAPPVWTHWTVVSSDRDGTISGSRCIRAGQGPLNRGETVIYLYILFTCTTTSTNAFLSRYCTHLLLSLISLQRSHALQRFIRQYLFYENISTYIEPLFL